MPRFDPETYRLRVEGLVERPLSLALADLQALPVAEQISDFHCVTGWTVEDVHWTGVRFRDVLAGAGPLPSARHSTFVSAERPYVDSLTLEQALLAGRDARLGHGRRAAGASARGAGCGS